MPALTELSQSLRATRVGASEVGAILGLDPFRGPMTVWERLTMGKETVASERMRIGSALEVPIAKLWAAERGERVRVNRFTHIRGRMAATADGFTRGGLLEVKWSAYSDMWGQGLPAHVEAQCVAQSWVWRGHQRRRVTVVALVEGKLRDFTVEPTRRQRLEVRDAVDAFMAAYVDTGEIPLPLFPHELLTYLYLLQGRHPEERRPATLAEQILADRLLAIRTSRLAYDREEEEARQWLLKEIAETGPRSRIVGDGWTASIDPPKEAGKEPRVTITANQGGTRTDG